METVDLNKLEKALVATGGVLENICKQFNKTAENANGADVNKSYTEPKDNYTLTNQNIGGVLPEDDARLFFTTIVKQSDFLNRIRKVQTNALVKDIDINNLTGKLVQVPEGTDPASGDFASTNNMGFKVYLQSVQFFYQLTFEELASYAKDPMYKQEKMADMSNEFANQLTDLALTGCDTSTSNLDIKAYSWISGTTFRSQPYIGLQGILEHIDNGYTYTESGSTKTASVGGRVSTYDTDNSKFKTIDVVIKELIKAYPKKYKDNSVKIFLSDNDFLDLQVLLAEAGVGNNNNLVRVENLDIYKYLGYELVPIRQLASIADTVTVATVPYYPGAVLMGREKDMMMIQNITTASYGETLDVMQRCYKHVTDVKVGFCAVPQRMAIACYRPSR